MIKVYQVLLVFISLLSYELSAQKKDTVYIRNFGVKDFKTSSINYTGLVDQQGRILFANENGILIYDGSEWNLITIKEFGSTYSLHQTEDGLIYVGGRNEYGYLSPEGNTYQYTSLRHTLNTKREFKEVWQVESLGTDIYFASYETVIRYSEGKSHVIDIDNGSIFKINNTMYVSRFDDGIYKIQHDSTILYNDTYHWKLDNVYDCLPSLKDNSYLLYTSENGIFSFYPDQNKIAPFETSDDEFIRKNWLYDGKIWNDSLYLFSMWEAGFMLMDQDGQIVYNITTQNGLLTDSYQDFVLDERNNIWTTSTNGISYIQWLNALPNDEFKAKTIISNVSADFVNKYQVKSLVYKFATPGYDKSDLDYSFYLKGYEDEFGTWTDDVKKEYTNLNSGEYIFHVKARLPNGQETEVVTSETFVIPVPWYNKPIFYLSSVILSITLILLLIKYRTHRLYLANKRLEKTVNSRTEELVTQKEQLKKANEELTLANKELDNFVYRSSHDLIAPLKSVKGLITLAERETGENSQLEYLNMMNKSVIKLEEFIRSIMDYSVNSKQELIKQPVLLDQVIESIKGDLKYFDNSEQVALIKNYDLDLTLNTDQKRLFIVLSNLITNCVKYHNYQQDNPFVKVNVKVDKETEALYIEISDNGIGIDEQHIEKIFDMFFRAAESKNQGSGLGLYIVKDTVQKLDGEITVKSKVRQGTTFTIKLNAAYIPEKKAKSSIIV